MPGPLARYEPAGEFGAGAHPTVKPRMHGRIIAKIDVGNYRSRKPVKSRKIVAAPVHRLRLASRGGIP